MKADLEKLEARVLVLENLLARLLRREDIDQALVEAWVGAAQGRPPTAEAVRAAGDAVEVAVMEAEHDQA
jgi:hypothetical protein